MPPTNTNVEERDQWRARINRAIAELQTDAPHIDGRVREDKATPLRASPLFVS